MVLKNEIYEFEAWVTLLHAKECERVEGREAKLSHAGKQDRGGCH